MKEEIGRIVIALVIFAVVFWGSPYIMGSGVYDINARATELLAAVLVAGCYWIGTNRH
ncbi:MAG: hypothetical protein LUH04_12720 [Clostridium sp.]|nr:hypothetical protein [Clostridium sp.]